MNIRVKLWRETACSSNKFAVSCVCPDPVSYMVNHFLSKVRPYFCESEAVHCDRVWSYLEEKPLVVIGAVDVRVKNQIVLIGPDLKNCK